MSFYRPNQGSGNLTVIVVDPFPLRQILPAYQSETYVPHIAIIERSSISSNGNYGQGLQEEIDRALVELGLYKNDYMAVPRGHAFREVAEKGARHNGNIKPPRINPNVEARINEMRRKQSRTINSIG